jgi:hypothetical protein
MKAKLLKTAKGHYVLVDETKETHDKDFLIATSRESDVSKLSIQNCDDIFGVIDIEKLAKEFSDTIWGNDDLNISKVSYIEGFNKAIELNKDKLFTIEDMGKLWDFCINNKSSFWECLESIQQPIEIEVEIECMFSVEENGESTNTGITKLDSNGCLILKKI